MPVLMKETQKREGKKQVLSCTSRCYDAKREQCACACGGINHSVGLQKALDNTRQMVGKLPGVEFNEKVLKITRPRDAKGHFIKREVS